MTFSRVASCAPSAPSGLMAKVLRRKPPASLVSNSASLRLPAPKSTARNDFVFSIAVPSRAARKQAAIEIFVCV